MFIRYESPGEFIKRFPITSIFIGINIIVFILMSLNGGSTNLATLQQFGAMDAALVEQGEWWRLITPNFIHIGFAHLFFNTISLLLFCSVFEKLLGSFRYMWFYLMCGSGSFFITYLFSTYGISAGASGSIYGVMGGFLYLYLAKHPSLDPLSRQIIAPLIVINILFTFFSPGVSVTGHIGGLVFGYGLSYFLFLKKVNTSR